MDFTRPGVPAIGAVIPGRNEATCMSYHATGKRLFVASQADNKLQVIDCLSSGKAEHPALRCEREQIHTIEATHFEHNILFAGKGSPTQPITQRNAINYWSVYDNKILRKFRGHSDQVTGIAMCPVDDKFLTASLDRTVRLWTVQQAGCLAELKLPDEKTAGAPLTAFDSTGLVFCVSAAMAVGSAGGGRYLHLYDARNFDAGAFAELKVLDSDLEASIHSHNSVTPDRAKTLSQGAWTSVQFNVSGNQLLMGAEHGMCVLLDGFEGTVQRALVSPTSSERAAVCCYTPDDKTVLQGNDDGTVTCWNVDTGTVVQTLKGHPGAVASIAANPKYTQIASACSQTALWTW